MLLHKFRRAMVNLEREPLRGKVEVDDTWIGGTQAGLRGSRQLKGRKAALVLVAVEKRGRVTGRVRMALIPDFKNTTLLAFLKQNVMPGSTIYTDGLKSFAGLQEAGFEHVPRTQPLRIDLRKGAKSVLPLAERAIGNLQQWLIGIYHGVSRDQLQVYLDEFVFRHNRRRQPMAAFQTFLGFGTGRKPTSYKEIRGGADLSMRSNKDLSAICWGLLKQPDKQETTSGIRRRLDATGRHVKATDYVGQASRRYRFEITPTRDDAGRPERQTPSRRLVRRSFRSFRRRSEVGYAIRRQLVVPLPRNPYRQLWRLRSRPDYPPKPSKPLVKHRAGVQLQETYLDTVYRAAPVRW